MPSEKPRNILIATAVTLIGFVGTGLWGMRKIEHMACEKVAKDEATMQASWDAVHPDGFTPVGDQMRPISFDCKAQERPFRPLLSYTDAAKMY